MTTSLPTFNHEFDVDASILPLLCSSILHSILFHRVMGSVKPKTSTTLGVYFVSVSGPEVERIVEVKTKQLVESSLRSHSVNPQLTVSLHSPSHNVRQGPYDENPTSTSPSTTSPNVRPTSGSYPSWLAQALATGIGHTSTNESQVPSNTTSSSSSGDLGGSAGAIFENWIIKFNVLQSKTERERNRTNVITGGQFLSFLNHILAFTDQYKTHIPPLTSNELCPYPITISVSQNTQV